jgi:hypothetical protein
MAVLAQRAKEIGEGGVVMCHVFTVTKYMDKQYEDTYIYRADPDAQFPLEALIQSLDRTRLKLLLETMVEDQDLRRLLKEVISDYADE